MSVEETHVADEECGGSRRVKYDGLCLKCEAKTRETVIKLENDE